MIKKGISSVIATILMLVIVMALAGLAYFFLSGVFTSKTAQIFIIADSYNDTVTIINDGTVGIESMTATVDGESVPIAMVSRIEGLVGYWKFDEGSGYVANDSSGNGNDGLLQNIYPIDVIANNPSLEEPWYLVAEQDADHRIERPTDWTVSYNFADSDKMLALQETGTVRHEGSAIRMALQFVPKFDGDTFDGSININDCDNRVEIDETQYLEGGNFQHAVKGPLSYADQTFYFYNATGDFLSRRWAYATVLDTDVGGGWRMRSPIWQPSSLDPNPPTQGGDIPYIPQGAKYACFQQYFVYMGGERDYEVIFDKFFIYQWASMPTDEQRIGRASSGRIDGKLDYAISFDGNDDYISIPDSDSLDVTTEFALSFWVYPLSDPDCDANNNWRWLVNKGGWGSYHAIFEQNRIIVGTIKNSTDNTYRLGTSTAVPLNTWTHYVLTYDSSTGDMIVYLNGLPDAQRTFPADTIKPDSNKLYINDASGGVFCPNGAGDFNGIIDDVRIYSRNLTEGEILQLFAGVIAPGEIATIKFLKTELTKGTHTIRLCTPSMCQKGYITII